MLNNNLENMIQSQSDKCKKNSAEQENIYFEAWCTKNKKRMEVILKTESTMRKIFCKLEKLIKKMFGWQILLLYGNVVIGFLQMINFEIF